MIFNKARGDAVKSKKIDLSIVTNLIQPAPTENEKVESDKELAKVNS